MSQKNADMVKNILIIGAGASFGARINESEVSRPPLGDKLLKYLLCKIDLNDLAKKGIIYGHQPILKAAKVNSLKNFLQDAHSQGKTYEWAVSELVNDSGMNLPLDFLGNLNRLLAVIFSFGDDKGGIRSSGFQPKIDLYDELCKKIDLGQNWTVISFNYDTLFESAALRNGLGPYYPGIEVGDFNGSLQKLAILKPHGSINWFRVADQHGTSETTSIVLDHDYDLPTHESRGIRAFRPENVLFQLSECQDSAPIMAQYAEGKYTFQELKKLKKIRENCLKEVQQTNHVYILGVRLAEIGDDLVVSKIFDLCRQKADNMHYINPSSDDCKKVRNICSNARFIEKGFSDWLRQLQM